jgi:hypothetical protein
MDSLGGMRRCTAGNGGREEACFHHCRTVVAAVRNRRDGQLHAPQGHRLCFASTDDCLSGLSDGLREVDGSPAHTWTLSASEQWRVWVASRAQNGGLGVLTALAAHNTKTTAVGRGARCHCLLDALHDLLGQCLCMHAAAHAMSERVWRRGYVEAHIVRCIGLGLLGNFGLDHKVCGDGAHATGSACERRCVLARGEGMLTAFP